MDRAFPVALGMGLEGLSMPVTSFRRTTVPIGVRASRHWLHLGRERLGVNLEGALHKLVCLLLAAHEASSVL